MLVKTVDPSQPRDDRLSEALAALERGGMVALPTETFYALAVDAHDAEALSRVNLLKRKADSSPILLLVSSASQAREAASSVPERFEELARLFWPGPLTLVVPAASHLPAEVGAGSGTVALRMPGLALPRRLAAMLGRPISGVSANPHGAPPCRTASEVVSIFPEGVDVVLDGGASPGGRPSTIVDLSGDRPKLVRKGLLPVNSLRPFLPDLPVESL